MTPPQLLSNEYGGAFMVALDRVIEAEAQKFPLVSRARIRKTNHSGRLRYVYQEPWHVDKKRSEFSFEITGDQARAFDLGALVLIARALGEQFGLAREKEIEAFLAEGTKRVGNTIPGNPKLTWDAILQMLDRMEIAFDDTGMPTRYELLYGRQAYANLMGSIKPPDYDERLMEIVQRKKEEWDAKKRSRRLPR